MSKYTPRVFFSYEIETRKHWAVGTEWTTIGSRGDSYVIQMVDKGFTCSCPAFVKCKKKKKIEENFI